MPGSAELRAVPQVYFIGLYNERAAKPPSLFAEKQSRQRVRWKNTRGKISLSTLKCENLGGLC